MTVLHAVAVGRAVAKRTVQLPHRWLIASRPSLQLVATTIDFSPTMISFLAIHSSFITSIGLILDSKNLAAACLPA